MTKHRVKKLTLQDRQAIRDLYAAGQVSMAYLATMFDVSRGRISQVVNDNYKERRFQEEQPHGQEG